MSRIFFSFLFIACFFIAEGQKVEVTLGPDEIGENQLWPITITVQNGDLKSFDKFPEITGFRKKGDESRTFAGSVNGQIVYFQTRIMYYYPIVKGRVINIPSFSMTINGKEFKVPGKKVTVKKFSNRPQRPNSQFPRTDPDDFFGDDEPEYVEIPDNAFLELKTDKTEVYIGEGVNVTLAFYKPVDTRASLDFYDLSKQVTEIVKKLKPTNCWEEDFGVQDIKGERIVVNGQDFIRYRLYEAVFFPFNDKTIKLPSVELEMRKLKVARNPSYFSPNTIEDFKTYTSSPKTVAVKELPPHPLRNSVAVGEFKLAEQIAKTQLSTGESTAYEFNIFGEGNIASLPKPTTRNDDIMEIYEPSVRQEIGRSGKTITGAKSFQYFMIPQEPGVYSLSRYFQWVYFSPARKKYDTLRSEIQVDIRGESKRNAAIESYDPGNFYDAATVADNTLRTVEDRRWINWIFQAFILLMVGTSAFLLFKK